MKIRDLKFPILLILCGLLAFAIVLSRSGVRFIKRKAPLARDYPRPQREVPDKRPIPIPPEDLRESPEVVKTTTPSDPSKTEDPRKVIKGLISLFKHRELYHGNIYEAALKYVNILGGYGNHILPELKKVIDDPLENIEARAMLLKVLGRLGSKEALEHLIIVFKTNPKQILRSYALVELVKSFKDERIFDAIKSVYDYDPGFEGRYNLVLAMGKTGDIRAIPVLFNILEVESDLETRAHAALALENFISKELVVEKLKFHGAYDRDPLVRKNSLRSLRHCKSDLMKRFFKERAKLESDPEVRRLARAILKEIYKEQ